MLDYAKLNQGFREKLEGAASDVSARAPSTSLRMTRQVALCFSGHPRAFLRYGARWKEFIDSIREEFELQIFYHMWSSTGLLEIADGGFRTGTYEDNAFMFIDQINEILSPASYCIETETVELNKRIEGFPSVYLNQSQSSKGRILSQIYSVEKSDKIRQYYEYRQSPSIAVIRMRFDLVPSDDMQAHKVIEEIRYIVDHPDEAIIFGTSPTYHRHHGGGGGCTYCDTAYRTRDTLKHFCVPEHQHSNDLCDLYAIGSSRSMAVYCSLFTHAETIWAEASLKSKSTEALGITPYPDQDNPQDTRVFLTGEQLEHDLHCFYPEKLLRFHLKDIAVVNSMAEFQIRRR